MMTIRFLLISTVLAGNLNGQTMHKNSAYGFSVTVPQDWHIYAVIDDDPENHVAILDWGLPKVHSEVEKQEIENAITITAYKRSDIKNIDELMNFEFNRIADILVSKTKLTDLGDISYNVITKRGKSTYVTKAVFMFRNNIGYVLNYTATRGTYEKNIARFTNFVASVVFFAPATEAKPKENATASVKFNGLYVAKTGSVQAGDTKLDIYNYIRFYEGGEVYTQSVSSYSPDDVMKWLGKSGRFERSGTYKISGSGISFVVNNAESPDKNIEGPMADAYSGKITDTDKLFLQVSYNGSSSVDFWFDFVPLQ